MTTEVRALKNFDYPKDLKVRDAIAGFHKVKKNDGVSWPGDRGERVEVSIGDVLDAPEDCLEHWLAEGIVRIPTKEGRTNG